MEHRAKKSLGQNFLKSHAALRKMAADISAADTVLEIGPGKGALTRELLAAGARVIAVEKDDRLIPILQEMFPLELSSGKLLLVHGDALLFDPETFKLKTGRWKLAANIPYYITGLLIRRYLESANQPSSMTILVQKEVAERIAARDGRESILSLSVKLFGTPLYKGAVSKRYFTPQPKVDSAILHIADIRHRLSPREEMAFFILIKHAFAHKRKMLLPNLSAFYEKKLLLRLFAELGFAPTARAENIPFETWLAFTHLLRQSLGDDKRG